MAKKKTLLGIWYVLKDSFSGFSNDKVPKLSASLAYCTVFSFPPLLIVITYACSLFFGRDAVEGSIYNQIKSFVGDDTAKQLQQIIKNATLSSSSNMAIIIGIIMLIVGATAIFGEVQDSINTIWGLKPKPKMGLKLMIKNRLLSFGVIGSLGFLLLVSLGISALVAGLGHKLQNLLPGLTIILIYIINILVTFGITTIFFAVIFKVLPDAENKWGEVWAGALLTTILFNLGKFAIAFYISKSKVGSTYGTSGALVILLVWIYYSSLILYFGAEFTKSWIVKYSDGVRPSPYAVLTQKQEIEIPNSNIRK